MDNEKTNKTSKFFNFSFGIMLLAVIGMGLMVFSMNETLKKQQKVLLQVPPELHAEILSSFQKSSDGVKDQILRIHDKSSSEIKADVKKQFEIQESLLQKQMVQIITSELSNDWQHSVRVDLSYQKYL